MYFLGIGFYALAVNSFAIDAAVALCTGKVGWRLFNHKYWFTGYRQLGSEVYHVGVPL
jgi:hypothetical protein